MTHSKSSRRLSGRSRWLAGCSIALGWRDGLSRAILAALAALLARGAGAFVLLDADAIARMLEDPAEFTGRAAIWAAELRYIADHPLLGAGFGTFTDTRSQSPLHNYVSGSWVDAVSHGHNGYLQVLVTIGGIGFVLAMLALVVAPMRRFWTLDLAATASSPCCSPCSSSPCCTISWNPTSWRATASPGRRLLLVIAALNATARTPFINEPLTARNA